MSILPPIELPQEESLNYMSQIYCNALDGKIGSDPVKISRLIHRYGVKPSQIVSRRYESVEIAASQKNITERTDFFLERAQKIISEFYPKESKAPDHLIHVTCTGYAAPSPAQCFANDQGWNSKLPITHAYHMGCYAALPSVRMAEGLVAAQLHRTAKTSNSHGDANNSGIGIGPTDIVHTEMCGLHLNPEDHSPEQIVVQSLFADGHIKYSARPLEDVQRGFEVLNVTEQIVGDSKGDMTWTPAPWGMKMSLSRDVPGKIAGHLRGFLSRLIEGCEVELSEVLASAVFAIHPGGPKIIDAAREVLEISADQVKASKHILSSRGNMSSATLPHVWKHLLETDIEKGRLVVSMAFGPGLTLFGSLYRVL